jgi:hypothetical protein
MTWAASLWRSMTLCNGARSAAYGKLLPDFIQMTLAAEGEAWKAQIFQQLPIVLKCGNSQKANFWLSTVDLYNSFETFSYEQAEVQALARMLYDFITTTPDMSLCMAAISLFTSMVNPHLDLVLDWRPL